jgi:RNA polymerase sigma-70 factor (sigma-E family)
MESVDRDRVLSAASEPQAIPVSGGDALSQVFEVEYGRLVRLASLLVDTLDEAEEVVQEAFARTLAGWSRVRDKDDATAYIRRAVVNLCHGRLRRRRVVRRLRPDDPGVAASAEHVVQNAEMAERVRAAVRRLPVRQRECVTLHYLLGRPVAEVAALLGVSDGTVKTCLSRARSRLASQLEERHER